MRCLARRSVEGTPSLVVAREENHRNESTPREPSAKPTSVRRASTDGDCDGRAGRGDADADADVADDDGGGDVDNDDDDECWWLFRRGFLDALPPSLSLALPRGEVPPPPLRMGELGCLGEAGIEFYFFFFSFSCSLSRRIERRREREEKK